MGKTSARQAARPSFSETGGGTSGRASAAALRAAGSSVLLESLLPGSRISRASAGRRKTPVGGKGLTDARGPVCRTWRLSPGKKALGREGPGSAGQNDAPLPQALSPAASSRASPDFLMTSSEAEMTSPRAHHCRGESTSPRMRKPNSAAAAGSRLMSTP